MNVTEDSIHQPLECLGCILQTTGHAEGVNTGEVEGVIAGEVNADGGQMLATPVATMLRLSTVEIFSSWPVGFLRPL